MAFISKAALAKGVAKRRLEAANEAARLQALAAGEVFAPMVMRRDPKAQAEVTMPAIQPSEEIPRAQACSDAKREAVRSNAIRPVLDEHPRFPGRPANWRPNRAQRAKLRRMGLL